MRIVDDEADEFPGCEQLAAEEADIEERRQRFASARESPFSDWFRETPALAAHIRAVRIGHHTVDVVAERLITTASAIAFTGRTRQVLYRWAKEGRVTRYGDESLALWDPIELPGKRAAGTYGPPPPKKS